MTSTGTTPPTDHELVRLACTRALADEPDSGFALADVERRGRRIVVRRRVGRGAAGLAVAASVAVAAGVWTGRPASVPSAVGPTSSSVTGPVESPTPVPSGSGTADPGTAIGLAVGFPLAHAFAAVSSALPAGVRIADVDPGGWAPGADGAAEVSVPLTGEGADAVAATLVVGPGCVLRGAAPLLDEAQSAAVARAVCAAWDDLGRPDPLDVPPAPTGPVDPAA